MNSKQAKQIELYKVLAHFGAYPIKTNNKYDVYHSPLRSHDNSPSFMVYKDSNLWIDYGSGLKGTVIDFIMEYKKYDFQSALNYMNQFFSNEIIDFSPPKTLNQFSNTAEKIKDYIINDIKPLQNEILLSYLKERHISPIVAKKYCKEIYWENANGKKIFAIGFKNNSDGYEVRNKFYKGNLINKAISFIDNKQDNLKIFEGFIDFLSYTSENIDNSNTHNYIILNSVVMAKQLNKENELFHIIEKHQNIECYLDNDASGKECFKNILSHFPNAIDKSDLYKDFNDYNEYLSNKPEENKIDSKKIRKL